MDNVIIFLLVLAVVGLAVWYIVNSKKKGQKCIGCPYSKECSSKGNCNENK